jgi:hypothetical protein
LKLLASFAALALAGCSSGVSEVRTTPGPTSAPPSEELQSTQASPSPTQEPTAVPTPEPAEAELTIRSTSLLVPQQSDFELMGFQVAAVVQNAGDTWAKLLPFDSEWTVLNASGGVTTTGQMGQAYPQYVEPGGKSKSTSHSAPSTDPT